ncbi:hypothetical protein A5N16_00815 [Arthrobacter sp. M6]|nr:hypothetical protein [Arthrobacter sp. M5]NKR14327.1 hypothetical protein [Arthrobacter sp. M6]
MAAGRTSIEIAETTGADWGPGMDWIAQQRCDATEGSQVFSALCHAQSNDECVVDLSKSGWVGPGMMASLAAFVDSRRAAGIPIKFVPPGDRDVRYYLSRMGMGKVLDAAEVNHGLPSVNANMALTQRALVEVAAFSSEDDVAALVSIVSYQSVAPGLQRAVSRALLEAGCNVSEHARVPRGFMAGQVINNQLRLSVADAGVGVLSTLEGSGATSEKQALLMAVNGTSEFADADRGRGLKSIHESISTHGGRGALISGQSVVTMSPNRLFAWTGNSSSYAGTILDVVLPIS